MTTTQDLISLLEAIDPYLAKDITLVAVGGTAMTLLGLKESTIDIDFDVPGQDDFNRLRTTLIDLGFSNVPKSGMMLKVAAPNGLVLDIFAGNYIFCVQLPDPLETTPIRRFNHIDLRALTPEDLILTKTARSDTRDLEDIAAMARNANIDFRRLLARYKQAMALSIVNHGEQLLLEMLLHLRRKGIGVPNDVITEAREWK